MILTGNEIARERSNGRITIEPFDKDQVNPNSYNFRLGSLLRVYTEMPLDPRRPNAYTELRIPQEGYVLEPGRLYLAHTQEVLGSRHYAPTFSARSSVARLGLFINLSASLGDIGFEGQWTLQLYTMNRVRVYPGMNIGQMMWWRPQGRIELYAGKYQGSKGPRSSDIHLDFDKTSARARFPGLSRDCQPSQVGGKFAALAAASRICPVPTAFVVPVCEFDAALPPDDAAEISELFAELRATVGAFFTESAARISAVAQRARLSDETRRLIAVRIRDVFGDPSGRTFAVRSSAVGEDSASASLAGVYQTVLGASAEGVPDAVEQCWQSYYAVPAIAARLRARDFGPQPRLAVIVQELIVPDLAGVAFTGLDGPSGEVTVEYVGGLAEELVAGTATPSRTTSADIGAMAPGEAGHAAALAEVVRLTRELRSARGHDVDVEWAADAQGVHVVQARPVTARRVNRDRVPARVWTSRLYFEDLPPGASLHEVAAVYAGYSAKRGPAYRLAAGHGISVGAGWVVGFTGRLLRQAEGAGFVRRTVADGHGEECVVDAGDTLRQIVVPKSHIVETLLEVSGAAEGSDLAHTVVIRDFVRGDLGIISRQAADGLVVEYAPEGLMALNRGTAGARAIVARTGGRMQVPGDGAAVLPHLDAIAGFTAAMQATYGEVTLEWVLDGSRLQFVDYSLLDAADRLTSVSGVRISAGGASGPLLTLDDDEMLRRLSIGPAVSIGKSHDVTGHAELARIVEKVCSMPEPPIVRARRPYAVLSVLIGMVAGFAFEEASALCHLAILLREAGTPAVAAAGLDSVPDGAYAVIGDESIAVRSVVG
ncbi:MAG TPA: PEP/pyruvate-binding domain-containing protein [Streptosporangiaceae bacterium]|nr:PEP/pyruvate-binding domain-containing protein [Streptosporangiaceae bacterium]